MVVSGLNLRGSGYGRFVRRGVYAVLALLSILILAAVAIPRFYGIGPGPAPRDPLAQDMSNIKTALAAFEIDNSRFPTTAEGLAALVSNPGSLKNWNQTLEKRTLLDPWGHPFVYRCPGINGADYDLYSTGPSGQDGNADNIR
jgi:general secretion pathway protein G